MGQGVQAHHVGRAKRARAGAAELFTRQVVHHVVAQTKLFCLGHGGQHAGRAHAVGNEVGRVLGPHHAFAQGGGDKSFQPVHHLRVGGVGGNELDQLHVARRVEKVDAAKTRTQRIGQAGTERCNRQPRGVACHDGLRPYGAGDAAVQIELPVHALGDGLDDQIAALERLKIIFIVGWANQRGVFGHTQGGGLELLEVVNGALGDAALGGCGVGQIKQQHRHLEVDQMRGDLRAHDASAENGHLANLKSFHGQILHCTRCQSWVR